MVGTPFAALFSTFFPDDCRVCGQPLANISRIPVCGRCLTDPVPLEAEFSCILCRTPFVNSFPLDSSGRCELCRRGLKGYDSAYCYGSYEATLRHLIHLLKYSSVRTLAGPLGGFLDTALPRDAAFDAVVPVPLHWRRRWHRGFNQSELLAREIGRRRRWPLVRALRRAVPTATQAGLRGRQRRDNVRGVFRAKGRDVAGKRILLIDDVLTTGATASACARALRQAGAAYVAILTVARVDRRFVSDPDFDRRRGSAISAVGGST